MAIANLTGILFIFLNLFGCKNPQPEDYLIPYGYKGRVDIVFNQKDGAAVRYEGGRRVYQIPFDGILKTQFKDEYGFIDHHYFYLDSTGKRIPLNIFQTHYNADSSTKSDIKDSLEVGIFLDGMTGVFGAKNKYYYQEFLVSDHQTRDSFFTATYKKRFEDKLNDSLNGLNDVDYIRP